MARKTKLEAKAQIRLRRTAEQVRLGFKTARRSWPGVGIANTDVVYLPTGFVASSNELTTQSPTQAMTKILIKTRRLKVQ